MNKYLPAARLMIVVLCLLAGLKANASHLYGGDLYYKWISGNTYQITLACYGDCSGGAFPSFHTSVAEVDIYKGLTLDTTIKLPCVDTNGTEVTPVCPKDTGNTACHGGTLPGIKRFIFQAEVTLSGTAPDWVFVFNGNLTSSSAGRSGSITNLSSAGTMTLLDTLNNVDGPNSSAEFTTIPTPFFCINELANFNPGAVDPDGDSLSFKLVPGITSVFGGTVGYVTYSAGYDYAHYPIAVKTPKSSNFSWDSTSGQLSFTPNTIQRSLVVMQVNKYKNGVLVGTSMREMTIVIIPCTSTPPTGVISNNNGGEIVTNYEYTVCQSQGYFDFHIDPQSTDGSNVTATATGLPSGAKYTVTGNGTKNPTGVFIWDASKAAPGVYKFFVTFQNDACPLSSKQTLVYNITIMPSAIISLKQTVLADCHRKGVIELSSSEAPWTAQIWQGKNIIDSVSGLTLADTVTDSLAILPKGDTYSIMVINQRGCITDTNFAPAHLPAIGDSAIITKPSCYGMKNGVIQFVDNQGVPPLSYHMDRRPDNLTGRFDSLATGIYTVTITDSVQCTRTRQIILEQPDSIHIAVTTAPNECTGEGDNGSAVVTPFGGTPPYSYLWTTAQPPLRTSAITGMHNGNYWVYVKDANGCTDSTIAVIGYDNCCTPFVPSAFSPNGDGKNDRFRIRYTGDLKLINMSVYNRYGERVYFSIYPDEGWDGNYAGVPQAMGEYFYFIKAKCGNKGDNEINLKGSFTLVR